MNPARATKSSVDTNTYQTTVTPNKKSRNTSSECVGAGVNNSSVNDSSVKTAFNQFTTPVKTALSEFQATKINNTGSPSNKNSVTTV